jgi:hypothetical protein
MTILVIRKPSAADRSEIVALPGAMRLHMVAAP